MLFNSQIFALFFIAVLAGYAALRRRSSRHVLLLVASYLFYAEWDARYLVLLMLSTAVDYTAGRALHASAVPSIRRRWLFVSLLTNLGILAAFKYGGFLVENLAVVLPGVAPLGGLFPSEIPLGISFYTFQTLSYTIDVYRRQAEPARSPLEFALYVSFFGQLVAGPIVRARDFLPQLRLQGDLRLGEVSAGVQRFLFGLFKKVVVADNAAIFVDSVFDAPGQYGAITLWCAAYAFALQIYCDFSGYTDMAIGIGRAFGLRIPENFDLPYVSRSITEFWRRWHLSLSTWLRDYLYISLGGSRRGRWRTGRNLMLTMLLGGLWHGAAWNFVIWGGFHGVLLAMERALGVGREPATGGLRDGLRWFVTLHLVCLGWVIFRIDGLDSLGIQVGRMLTDWAVVDAATGVGLGWAVALWALVALQFVEGSSGRWSRTWEEAPSWLQGAALAGLILLTGWLHVDQAAFIYFQF